MSADTLCSWVWTSVCCNAHWWQPTIHASLCALESITDKLLMIIFAPARLFCYPPQSNANRKSGVFPIIWKLYYLATEHLMAFPLLSFPAILLHAWNRYCYLGKSCVTCVNQLLESFSLRILRALKAYNCEYPIYVAGLFIFPLVNKWFVKCITTSYFNSSSMASA